MFVYHLVPMIRELPRPDYGNKAGKLAATKHEPKVPKPIAIYEGSILSSRNRRSPPKFLVLCI